MAMSGRYDDFDLATIRRYFDLNVKAVVMMCEIVIPFMKSGSHIISMSSRSSFQTLPYLNLYASGRPL